MKLFLASEAKNPKSLEDLSKFIAGFSDKKLVFIPTASNGEHLYGNWKTGESWKVVQQLFSEVTTLVLEEVKSPSELEVLKNADVIWLAGGVWGYLMYWLRRHKLDELFPQLAKQGITFVGSSAGAGVFSERLDIAEWWRYGADQLPEPEVGGSIFPGLGLVDFDIYPHYKDELYDHISKHYQGKKMFLLKDGESIEVVDGKIKINGEERVL